MASVSGVASVSVLTSTGRTVNLSNVSDVLPVFVETKDFGGDDVRALKFIEEIVPEVEGNNSIQVTVKVRETLNANFTEDGPFDLASGNDPVFCWSPGSNYIRLRFFDDVVAGRWKMNKVEVYGRVEGKRY